MLYFSNVSKIYKNDSESLRDVSLTISRGEFVAIMGHSGAGKSTLMRLILGEEEPTEGTIFFESTNIHTLPKKELLSFRRRMGTIFQDFRLINSKTVFENVAFAMEITGHSDEDIAEYVPHVLELVGLTDKKDHFPKNLSGGEKQRVAIARAIIHQPEIILADEPTASLDPVAAHDVMGVLRKIADLGATVVMTTHTPDLAHKYAKRSIVLEKGKIIRDDNKHKSVSNI